MRIPILRSKKRSPEVIPGTLSKESDLYSSTIMPSGSFIRYSPGFQLEKSVLEYLEEDIVFDAYRCGYCGIRASDKEKLCSGCGAPL